MEEDSVTIARRRLNLVVSHLAPRGNILLRCDDMNLRHGLQEDFMILNSTKGESKNDRESKSPKGNVIRRENEKEEDDRGKREGKKKIINVTRKMEDPKFIASRDSNKQEEDKEDMAAVDEEEFLHDKSVMQTLLQKLSHSKGSAEESKNVVVDKTKNLGQVLSVAKNSIVGKVGEAKDKVYGKITVEQGKEYLQNAGQKLIMAKDLVVNKAKESKPIFRRNGNRTEDGEEDGDEEDSKIAEKHGRNSNNEENKKYDHDKDTNKEKRKKSSKSSS